MHSYSITLAVVGMLIGILTLSATAFAQARPPEEAAAEPPVVLTELPPPDRALPTPARTWAEALLRRQSAYLLKQLRSLVPSNAGQAPSEPDEDPAAADRFLAGLRAEGPEAGALFLADADGNPLQRIQLDRDGDAALGPVAPGRYSVTRDGVLLGRFRMLDNAALTEADGCLWTDGELLYLSAENAGSAF